MPMNSISGAKFYTIVASVAVLLFACAVSATADNFISAQTKVRGLVTQLVGDAKNMRQLYETDEQKYYQRIRDLAIPSIAISVTSRFVLGRHWKLADKAQRQEFIQALQTMLIRSYGKALIVLEESSVEFLPAHNAADVNKRKQTIRTRLTTKNNTHINVDYVVLQLDNEWKIFDLVIDGLSMAKQLRRSFDTEIQETGLSALIARLRSEK